jgi:hypothetical protein
MMSLENQGIFQLLKEVTYHCSTVIVYGNFVRHSLTFFDFMGLLILSAPFESYYGGHGGCVNCFLDSSAEVTNFHKKLRFAQFF